MYLDYRACFSSFLSDYQTFGRGTDQVSPVSYLFADCVRLEIHQASRIQIYIVVPGNF